MGDPGLLEQGVDLMLVGMGTVFVFLTVLVAATGLMSSLVRRFLPEPIVEPPDAGPNGELLAVIGAAVAAHRHRDDG